MNETITTKTIGTIEIHHHASGRRVAIQMPADEMVAMIRFNNETIGTDEHKITCPETGVKFIAPVLGYNTIFNGVGIRFRALAMLADGEIDRITIEDGDYTF